MGRTRGVTGELVRLYVEGELCATKSIQVSYSIDAIPTIDVELPATPDISRAIISRLRVDVIFMDYGYSPPRLVSFCEGEILEKGFFKSASGQRSFNFSAAHFTYTWQQVPIHILGVDDQQRSTIGGKEAYQTFANGTIKGSIYELFAPKRIQEVLKQLGNEYTKPIASNPDEATNTTFDIYDYVRAAAQFYETVAKESITKDSYDFTMLPTYEPSKRIFYPDGGSKILWDNFFQELVALFYNEVLAGIGGELTYLSAMKQLLSILLHEIIVLPNPRDYAKAVIPKPMLPFSPVPRCNFLLPIFSPTFHWHESHEGKPTRLIQYSMPALVNRPNELLRHFRNVAPPELAEKFKKFDEAMPKNGNSPAATVLALSTKDKPFTLVTAEEKKRGIINSSNDVPSYMTAAISLLYKGQTTTTTTAVGAPVATSTPIRSQDRSDPVEAIFKASQAAVRLAFYQGALSEYENFKLNNLKDVGLKAAVESPDYFMPKRFVIVSYTDAVKEKPENRAHYTIKNQQVTLNRPRYYGLYQEAFILPKLLHVNNLKGRFIMNRNFTFLDESDKGSIEAESRGMFSRLGDPTYVEVKVETTLKSMTGFMDSAIVIEIDQADITPGTSGRTSWIVAAKLISLIAGICEPSLNLSSEDQLKSSIISYEELGIVPNNHPKYAPIGAANIQTIRDAVPQQITLANNNLTAYEKKGFKTLGYSAALRQLNKLYKASDNIVNTIDNKILATMPDVTDYTDEVIYSAIEQASIKDIQDKYTQPICNFYFYYNRFASSSQNIPMSFNPYMVPGFSTIIMDAHNEEYPLHLLGYVTGVSHTFTASSISSTASVGLMRRVDSFVDGLLTTLSAEQKGKTDTQQVGDLQKGEDLSVGVTTISQFVQDMPFYGQEWKGLDLEDTLTDLLGEMGRGGNSGSKADPATVRLSEVLSPEAEPVDVYEAFRRIRRPMQTVKIQVYYLSAKGIEYLNSTTVAAKLKEIAESGKGSLYDLATTAINKSIKKVEPENLKELAKEAFLAVNQNNAYCIDAPSKIAALYPINAYGLISYDSESFPDRIIVDGIRAFDDNVTTAIKKHTQRCRNREGIIGGDSVE